MTVILAYLFFFIAASASPLQRRWLATRDDVSHEGQIHFSFLVMGIISFLGLFLPLISPFEIHGDIRWLFALAFLCGLTGAIQFVMMFTAQRHVEAGVSSLVSNIYTPTTIVLASLFLNERLSPIQIVGTILMLVGMVIVSKKHRIGRFKFDKYFVQIVFSGILLGVMLTAERTLQKTTGFSAGTMMSWWSQFAFLGLATIIFKSKSKYPIKDTVITGVLRFFQAFSWVLLLFIVGNLSLVSSITTFKVVIIFFAGAIFLHEREDLPRKIVGSLIAVAGLLLM